MLVSLSLETPGTVSFGTPHKKANVTVQPFSKAGTENGGLDKPTHQRAPRRMARSTEYTHKNPWLRIGSADDDTSHQQNPNPAQHENGTDGEMKYVQPPTSLRLHLATIKDQPSEYV